MRDMNDMYVNDNCQTLVHICGYAFTVAEFFDYVVTNMSQEDLEKHKEY